MFTFHRPKIYRSVNGCCICGAKSSSSRFTDSKRYETEFQSCFNLNDAEQRAGEICNACVLLIKRWKKLPKGTDRNWNHVVDARAGPGGKSQLRSKLRHRLTPLSSVKHSTINNNVTSSLPRHTSHSHSGFSMLKKYKHRSPKKMQRMRRMRLYGMRLRSDPDSFSSPPSPTNSDSSETCIVPPVIRKRTFSPDVPKALKSIVDTSYWKREKVCCGTIFKGLDGEVLIHPQLLRPCPNSCLLKNQNVEANSRSRRPDSLGSDGSGECSELDEHESDSSMTTLKLCSDTSKTS
ncbi:SIN3-HDAC complex-associated factor [Holothuria leucospilota]|uniref:SIN3-HDAC complex-associated factor n=1 Tax=Holothuria leucospilota TaxID=206669 RepID=A0A9Q1H4E4_HOLLE|nr:SIN3-HDAC complex-associated factor [Holothuria leucospilota]